MADQHPFEFDLEPENDGLDPEFEFTEDYGYDLGGFEDYEPSPYDGTYSED